MARDLPTPSDVLQGLLLVLIMVPPVQWALMGIGVLLVLFHHWIIGGILFVVGLVAHFINRQLRF